MVNGDIYLSILGWHRFRSRLLSSGES
jgi:hypothetical protein